MAFLKSFLFPESRTVPLEGFTGVALADAIFQDLVATNRVPGLSVIIERNGVPLLCRGYGYTDMGKRRAVDPNATLFRIASISKCITALALGTMVEEGLVDWDDSLYQYVPYYPKKRYDFTLRQLANHTAGIRGYRGKEYGLNMPFSIREGIAVFQDDALVFEPGNGYLYNSFDFVLLSLAMQEASGVPFQEYVKEKVLVPLGMQTTLAPGDYRRLEDGAKGKLAEATYYTKRSSGFSKALEVNNGYKLAGGGYLSTARDIALLGRAILERRLLNGDTYGQLFENTLVNGRPVYYGLGFQVSKDALGRPFVGHVGSSVGAYTNFFVYPETGTTFSMLINCTDPRVQQQMDEAINAINTMEVV